MMTRLRYVNDFVPGSLPAALVMLVLCGSWPAAAQDAVPVDGFTAGRVNGQTVSWLYEPEYSDAPDGSQGIAEVSVNEAGHLVIRGNNAFPIFPSVDGKWIFVRDVSYRMQASAIPDSNLSFYLRTRPDDGDTYFGGMDRGRAVFQKWDDMDTVIFEGRPLDASSFEQDLAIQVDAIGDQLSVWVWPEGDERPERPSVSYTDSEYSDGGLSGLAVSFWEGPDTMVVKSVEMTTLLRHAPGDVDGNQQLDVEDIHQLVAGFSLPHVDIDLDLTSDLRVNQEDLTYWVRELKGTWLGDANLDGEFNSADLVQVFMAGEYEDGTEGNSTWRA